MEKSDELLRCEKCEKPTLHRDGKCRSCATIREIGALKAKADKGHFDFVRGTGVVLILGLFGWFIYSLVSG